MKTFLTMGLLLAAGLPLRAEPPEIKETLAVDKVWSGHPVSFAFLTERGHQFIAYYDAGRRITVAGRKLGSDEWTIVHPDGVAVPGAGRDSNVTNWDSHNYLALTLDGDGCIHLSGNMHNNPLVYYRSEKPFDVASLKRIDHMTDQPERSVTYPVFFKNAKGDLMFRYRDGGSGNGNDIYNIYDTSSRAWRNVLATQLLDGEGQRNAYALDPTLGPDGRFHLVWMWRDTPDAATNHTLSYARSADFQRWETSGGKPIELPITLARGEVVDPAKPRQGLINMTFALGFDADKKPIVVYHRYDTDGKSQAYVARPQFGRPDWQIEQISDWDFRWQFGGGGSIPADVVLGAPFVLRGGALGVDFATKEAGNGRWRLDPRTLKSEGPFPPAPDVLPDDALKPETPDMEVQTVVSRDDGRRWVLRWETMPRNRDQPREEIPEPTALRVYEVTDGLSSTARRVGS